MASRPGISIWAILLLLVCPVRGYADKLQFTSNPSGATVELDGVAIGSTPCEKEFPGGYFHKTKTSFGSRLEHPLVARISLAGYATKELTLTEGPLNWVSLNGRSHGEYWLFKTNHFHIDMESISEAFTGDVVARVAGAEAAVQPQLSLEELVRQTKPAVVYLKAVNKSGTGFFVAKNLCSRCCPAASKSRPRSYTLMQTWMSRSPRWRAHRHKLIFRTLLSPMLAAFVREKACWRSGIPATRCFSASRRGSSAPWANFQMPARELGFRRMLPSIPATAVARS
jgi:hypothetical protein